ncbi:MAG TPA: FAD-dependent oxidoreductase [Candidatus Saccharimonadales bacterium]|nr:FAD-dependent oxidoreductase [Candidatus Saccharimonadales bacterium]
MEKTQKQHVLVVGGGFAGVKTALALAKNPEKFTVTLVSERSDFWYFPTMYHTATGGTRSQSSIPIRFLLKDTKVRFVEGKAKLLDRAARTLKLEDGTDLPYDKLVLALGVVTNYFGIPGLPEYSFGIKSIGEAEELKRHLHSQVVSDGKPDLNYVVVGGGPTGIELAGSLGLYLHFIMKRHGVTGRKIHVDLVENAPHLMPRLPKSVGKAIERRLRQLGVKLYLGKQVQGETADELTVSGKPIRSHTVIWTAGQANNPFFSENGFTLSPRKKVVVDEFLRAEKDIFVIGDNAETMYSGMAQTAVYDAEFVALNFIKEASSEPKLAYRPKRPIYVTPVGPLWASVQWGKQQFNGKVGWFLREAADFEAFSELESLPDAAAQWAHVLQDQHLCEVCGSVS